MKNVFALIILLAFSSLSVAEKGILLAVSVVEGNNGDVEYYGFVDGATFDSISNELTKGKMFKLEDVFWINAEGKKERMSTTSRNGHRFGYTNKIFLREDTISRIVILDKEYLDKLKEK